MKDSSVLSEVDLLTGKHRVLHLLDASIASQLQQTFNDLIIDKVL